MSNQFPTRDDMAQELGFPTHHAMSRDTEGARNYDKARGCWYPYCVMQPSCHPRPAVMGNAVCRCTYRCCSDPASYAEDPEATRAKEPPRDQSGEAIVTFLGHDAAGRLR